ncbi:hypothetical protein HDV02_001272 [Globomyces sp. JEL0801]|nr:hypothetical protein HDV02_001272 [Globomyces sp. JEL0801]
MDSYHRKRTLSGNSIKSVDSAKTYKSEEELLHPFTYNQSPLYRKVATDSDFQELNDFKDLNESFIQHPSINNQFDPHLNVDHPKVINQDENIPNQNENIPNQNENVTNQNEPQLNSDQQDQLHAVVFVSLLVVYHTTITFLRNTFQELLSKSKNIWLISQVYLNTYPIIKTFVYTTGALSIIPVGVILLISGTTTLAYTTLGKQIEFPTTMKTHYENLLIKENVDDENTLIL